MQTANVNVPIRITGRHLNITDAIREYAQSKVEHIHLDYPRIIEVHVILDVAKHRHFAEIVLHCANHITIEAHTDGSAGSLVSVRMDNAARETRRYAASTQLLNRSPFPRLRY